MQVFTPDSTPLPKDIADAVSAAKDRADVLRLEAENWQKIARNEERNAKNSVAERLAEEEKIAGLGKTTAELTAQVEKLSVQVKTLEKTRGDLAGAISQAADATDKIKEQARLVKEEAATLLAEAKKESEAVTNERAKLTLDQETFDKKVEAIKNAIA